MFHLRTSYVPPMIRPSSRAGARVGSVPETGAAPDVWVVVTTDASRAFADKASDLKVGDIVRFTAQYGLRSKEDSSNMIVVRGKVVSPRNPITPDSYGVEAQEVASSYDLDPSVALPYVGQIFLVAPWSIAAVEGALPVPGEPVPETSAEPPTPSSDETTGKAAAPEAAKPAAAPPAPPTGAPPLPKQEPTRSNAALYAGLGIAAAALVGLGVWHFWPA